MDEITNLTMYTRIAMGNGLLQINMLTSDIIRISECSMLQRDVNPLQSALVNSYELIKRINPPSYRQVASMHDTLYVFNYNNRDTTDAIESIRTILVEILNGLHYYITSNKIAGTLSTLPFLINAHIRDISNKSTSLVAMMNNLIDNLLVVVQTEASSAISLDSILC